MTDRDRALATGTRIVRLGAVFFLDPTTHEDTYAVVVEENQGKWYRAQTVCPLHPDIIPDLLATHSFTVEQ
jgi:glycine betaine/choline ABC-type transport system substrate-binding protein